MKLLIAVLIAGSAPAGQTTGMDASAPATASPEQTALHQLRQRAANGDADAMFRLGDAYREGRLVAADLKTAEDFYFRAAQAGHKEAAMEYGMLLFRRGRQHDAMPFLIEAAKRGDARAQYLYGTALFNGDYVSRDWTKAYEMMTRAAAGGIEAANASLAQMTRYMTAEQRQQPAAGAAAPAPSRVGEPPRTGAGVARPSPVQTASRTATSSPNGRTVSTALAGATRAGPAPAAVAPKAPVSGGKWQVQLGAFGDAANARRLWAELAAKQPALAALAPSFPAADGLTRLRAGPLPDRAAAARLCAALAAQSRSCFPVAP